MVSGVPLAGPRLVERHGQPRRARWAVPGQILLHRLLTRIPLSDSPRCQSVCKTDTMPRAHLPKYRFVKGLCTYSYSTAA